MTKEQKQFVLIGVLSLTLYAVWPSSRMPKTERDADASNVRPVSKYSSDRESEVDRKIPPPPVNTPVATAFRERQRWSIDEILANETFQGNIAVVDEPARGQSNVQAIYFSSPAVGSPTASAVVGGRVVSQGQRLAPDRTVLEIREAGIAVGR